MKITHQSRSVPKRLVYIKYFSFFYLNRHGLKLQNLRAIRVCFYSFIVK